MRLHVVPRLPLFLTAHPDLSVDLILDDREVDLVEEGVDIALRMGRLRDSSLAARWDKRLGILGALGSCVTFLMTVTIIPFMPGGWAASAGGFPAMTGNVPFLMKDVVLFAASVYLLKQDVMRVSLGARRHDISSWRQA
jgi:Protein of unknown function, DUF417/LysR substrate binding domain